MAGPEAVPGRRRWRLGAVLGIVAIIGLVAHEFVLARRIAALEAAVAQRDAADPLIGAECWYSLPRHGELAGGSRDKPCIVTFQRLLEAPQQFHGRWVEVQGRYVGGFERSALYPVDSKPPDGVMWEPTAHALWVDAAPFAPLDANSRGVFVGRFRRGPGGHLAAYYATLNDR